MSSSYHDWAMQAVGHLCAVEFVGGPFDGHKHVVASPGDELAALVSIPVNRNMFRMLEGKPRGPKSRATSVAVYELHHEHGVWQYRYLGATTPEQCHFDQWFG
jgi:hypothetical protein